MSGEGHAAGLGLGVPVPPPGITLPAGFLPSPSPPRLLRHHTHPPPSMQTERFRNHHHPQAGTSPCPPRGGKVGHTDTTHGLEVCPPPPSPPAGGGGSLQSRWAREGKGTLRRGLSAASSGAFRALWYAEKRLLSAAAAAAGGKGDRRDGKRELGKGGGGRKKSAEVPTSTLLSRAKQAAGSPAWQGRRRGVRAARSAAC